MMSPGPRVVRPHMDGREVEQWVELSLDGELAQEEGRRIRRELAASPDVAATFDREMRFQSGFRHKLKQATDDMATPSHLRAQVVATLNEVHPGSGRAPSGRALATCIALAGLAVVSWVTVQEEFDPEGPVSVHSTNPPPDVRPRGNPATVRSFFQGRLGFDVPLPTVERHIPNLRLVGARLAHIKDRDTAYLMYEKRGSRVSVFAFPKRVGFRRPEHFVPHEAGGRQVLVGRHRGYNVTYFEDDGLVYSVVGEIEPVELKQLAASF